MGGVGGCGRGVSAVKQVWVWDEVKCEYWMIGLRKRVFGMSGFGSSQCGMDG
jgi:hypothetical protein